MTTKRHFLIPTIVAAFALWLAASFFASSQTLPTGWWQQSSPEELLAKSESITRDLTYFQGTKAHLLNDRDASIEFFQRKLPDGTIETKYIYHQGRKWFADYKLTSGRYFSEFGRIIKCTFEDDQKERSLAATLTQPYDYKMLEPEIVGTNDCLVVARVTTPQFFEMLTTNYYPGYSGGQGGALGDLAQYIGSETDVYIRKSDGVIIGEIKKSKSGTVLDDRLYDVVQVNNPIPSAEFVLPEAPLATATNTAQLLHITAEARRAYNSQSPLEVKLVHYVIIGAMIASSGTLLVLLYFRFHRRNLGSTNGDDKR